MRADNAALKFIFDIYIFKGRGKDAFGFMDTFVDRLFQYIGGKEVYHVCFDKLLPSLFEEVFLVIYDYNLACLSAPHYNF